MEADGRRELGRRGDVGENGGVQDQVLGESREMAKWPGGCRFQSRLGTLCSIQFPLLMCSPGDHREHSMSASPGIATPTAGSGVALGQCSMEFLNLEE